MTHGLHFRHPVIKNNNIPIQFPHVLLLLRITLSFLCIPSSTSVSHPPVPKQARNERLLTNQVTTHSRGTNNSSLQSSDSACCAQSEDSTTGGGSKDSATSLPPEATVSATCIRNRQDSPSHAPQTNPLTTEGNRHFTNQTQLHEELEGNASRATILGFTKGTLQSPQKPAHGRLQSFVRVDDFIAALAVQSREAESLLRDPRLVAKLSGHPPGATSSTQPISLLSHLLTRQPLPGTTARKPPATASSPPLPSVNRPFSVPLNPKCLVPITATVETNSTKKPSDGDFKLPPLPLFPQPLSTQILPLPVPPTSCGSLGFVTPRALITTPSPQFVARQILLPNTTPTFAPLTPRTTCLPTLSGSIPAATPMTRCLAMPHPLVGECPPLKRAKLD
ncbi:hypothetical protein GBAR_LOCUS13973 [Geodia barretti]|uniref:Uncharacterized protein n=1 Tax=Geodia barretti TaxID=519541 RepID=A0AA35S684_GEOBA|nr:hypothetical protein GBAR_LOCUS13973 [Geodia barretti]